MSELKPPTYNCIVKAGCYITGGSRVPMRDGSIMKAKELSGKNGVHAKAARRFYLAEPSNHLQDQTTLQRTRSTHCLIKLVTVLSALLIE